jgi:hypothetical protein
MNALRSSSDLQICLDAEARQLRDLLQAVSMRLGTSSERPDDFVIARRTAHRLRNIQMALAGIAELRRVRIRRRGPLASPPSPGKPAGTLIPFRP